MRYIVVTDLDGTLLDHQTYEFTAAKDAIAKLSHHNIPIILNSSKTKAEIVELRSQLNNKEPFVCENGGLVCFPATDRDGKTKFDIEYLGVPRKQFIDPLDSLKEKLNLNYQGFAHATINDVARWTGLNAVDAERAMQREATEPLLWNDTELALEKFRTELQKLNLQCVKGGRFHHVMGNFNKASCFVKLKTYYSQFWQEDIGIVALGDSQNDLPMLEEAEVSIVVPNRGKTLPLHRNDSFVATQIAPQGWQEGINYCFKNIF